MKIQLIKIVWGTVKAMLREKFIALNASIKKEKPQVNHLSCHLENLDRENKPKINRKGSNVKQK